jgi:hypothetical protein
MTRPHIPLPGKGRRSFAGTAGIFDLSEDDVDTVTTTVDNAVKKVVGGGAASPTEFRRNKDKRTAPIRRPVKGLGTRTDI